MCICEYTYLYMYSWIYMYINVYLFVYIHIYIHKYMCIYIYTHTYAHTQTLSHTHYLRQAKICLDWPVAGLGERYLCMRAQSQALLKSMTPATSNAASSHPHVHTQRHTATTLWHARDMRYFSDADRRGRGVFARMRAVGCAAWRYGTSDQAHRARPRWLYWHLSLQRLRSATRVLFRRCFLHHFQRYLRLRHLSLSRRRAPLTSQPHQYAATQWAQHLLLPTMRGGRLTVLAACKCPLDFLFHQMCKCKTVVRFGLVRFCQVLVFS